MRHLPALLAHWKITEGECMQTIRMKIRGNECALSFRDALDVFKSRRPFNGKRLPPNHPCSMKSLANKYGVSMTTIGQIANGRLYKELKLEEYYTKN